MEQVTTKEEVLRGLDLDWGTFVERFQKLSPEAQHEYLAEQGYARLGDLLGHVCAWWQDGMGVVAMLRENPEMPPKEYDVDLFNKQAIERFAPMSDAEVIQEFEATRQQMRKLAESLPEEAYHEGRIARRMRIEVVGHYDEHRLD